MKGLYTFMCCQFSNKKQGEGEWRGHSHIHENNKITENVF